MSCGGAAAGLDGLEEVLRSGVARIQHVARDADFSQGVNSVHEGNSMLLTAPGLGPLAALGAWRRRRRIA